MSNANQDNLWQELTNQGHIDSTLDRGLSVKLIMDSWTLKKGYPVVHIERILAQDQQVQQPLGSNATVLYETTLRIKQKWFLLNPLSKMLTPGSVGLYNSYKWYVPFTFTTKSKLNFDFETKPFWLKPNDAQCKYKIFIFF